MSVKFEDFYVNADGIYSYHFVLKGLVSTYLRN
jgi:hypothetical protein